MKTEEPRGPSKGAAGLPLFSPWAEQLHGHAAATPPRRRGDRLLALGERRELSGELRDPCVGLGELRLGLDRAARANELEWFMALSDNCAIFMREYLKSYRYDLLSGEEE